MENTQKNSTLYSMLGSTFDGTGSAIYGYGVYNNDNGSFSTEDAFKNDVRLPHDLSNCIDLRSTHELIIDVEADALCKELSGEVIPSKLSDLK